MSTERQTLTLIDGSAYIFRAYHAIRSELTTSKGLPTRAVFGFARMMLKSLREASPTHVAVVWDKDGRALRQKIDPEYKAHRPSTPEDLKVQFPYIRQVVDALAVPSVEKEGWEADDLIATLSKEAVAAGFDVVIVTGDKDFSQIVGPHVRLYDGMMDKWTGPAEVEAKWGVPPERFLELQALLGDSVDNIPGIPGVGEKTAAELVARFGDAQSVIAACERGEVSKKKVAASIVEGRERIATNRELARLRDDVELPMTPAELVRRQPDPAAVQQLFRELEFFALLRELPGLLAELPPGEAAAVAPTVMAAPTFEPPPTLLVTDSDALASLVARIREAESVGLRAAAPDEAVHDGAFAGLAVAIPGGPSAYLPLAHRGIFAGPQLPRDVVLRAIGDALAGKRWTGTETGRDLALLLGTGLTVDGPAGDAAIASYLLNPARRTFAVTDLSREKLGFDLAEPASFVGTGKDRKAFADLEPAVVGQWMGAAAACAIEIEAALAKELGPLETIYRELELPLVPILARMEAAGVRLDIELLRSLDRELEGMLAKRLAECFAAAGHEFNVASPKQLAQVLFEELKLPVQKRTKTGPSTDHEVLEKLSEQHPLPGLILEHRSLAKLKGTYVEALPRLVGRDGRLHTTFDQTNTATGRLASLEPNLMNIPIRTELGKRIREAFVADEGSALISADYSQIELRILAHVTGDPGLVEALRAGADVHRRTAAEVFGVDEGAVTSDQRRIAKMINYAVAYGLSAFGLSTRLDIPPGEASAIIQRYFEKYAGVKAWIDRIVAEAKVNGFVSTLDGRRRFLPDLQSRNPALRQAAERAAINMPIQGTAADIIKRAMIVLDAELRRSSGGARLLLQVHDELVLEVPEAEVADVSELVRRTMEGAASLAVPLVVDVSHGPNWAAAH
ncbi:DNA polymerase I [Vulgatibacter incomptus]|nr:DNA polymerase I [Vulgatibacter incomptus]